MNPRNCWLIIGALLLAGCQYEVSTVSQQLVQQKVHELHQISGLPRKPNIVYTTDRNYGLAGSIDCKEWTITINAYLAERRTYFITDRLVPHEYAHLESCYHRGGVGVNPHDEYWKNWVIFFGGDPEYI